jgi:hypothetical protein
MQPTLKRPRNLATPAQSCQHRGPSIGRLNCGCCGNASVFSCTLHGRCTLHAAGKPTPLQFTPDAGGEEMLTRDRLPAVCSLCIDRPRAEDKQNS